MSPWTPLTADDVLAAHEAMEAFVVEVAQGNVHRDFVSAWTAAHLEALPAGMT